MVTKTMFGDSLPKYCLDAKKPLRSGKTQVEETDEQIVLIKRKKKFSLQKIEKN